VGVAGGGSPDTGLTGTAQVQHFISSYGYLAILLLTAESACTPVPSELTMPFGAATARMR
jgi:membrane protein DedA with SNARE-associated domain